MPKGQVCAKKPTNLNELHQFCRDKRSNIMSELFTLTKKQHIHIEFHLDQKHLVKVKLAKEHLTKY